MANLTNDKFMEELDQNYPDFNWNNFDIETYPDVWVISAKTHERTVWIEDGKDDGEEIRIMETSFETEYASLGEAEAAVERIKLSTKEQLIRDSKYWRIYLGPILFDSYKIRKTKPREAVDLEFKKICREAILEGRKVFPMYLP